MKDRKSVTSNGRAVFYAAMWDDLRQAAMDCGWALALHGSLSSDMDIMAMPWVENAATANEMVERIIDCFGFCRPPHCEVDKKSKPNGRVVYTIPVYSDFYIDLNIIEQ